MGISNNIMKLKYREIRLSPANLERLTLINSIIAEYQDQGYTLSLRQLYYQLVTRLVIANDDKEYKKLSHLLKEGRLAGIVDWSAIEDRLRVPRRPACWNSVSSIIESCASQFRHDRMDGQETYIEVWVEKDALSGVLSRVTDKYGIMVNRGYSSVSAMHDSYLRIDSEVSEGKKALILYLGDHDPSGLDMIRDIRDRLEEFHKGEWDGLFSVIPVALTMSQIKEHNPPPNPAKLSDSRAKWYVEKYGYKSWEVDALPPEALNGLLESAIVDRIDVKLFEKVMAMEMDGRATLTEIATNLN